jgi:Spy/CpxP family protein refolding chaperone
MNRSRFWLIIVVLLLLVNTVVLAMIWLKKPEGPAHGESAKDFLIKELKLSDAQQAKFDALRQDHQKKIKEIMDGMKGLKDELAEKISAAQTDTSALDSLTRQIGEKEIQRDLATFYHFRTFRTILTKEQQDKFDKILKQVLRMMAGPQRPPQGPPPSDRP